MFLYKILILASISLTLPYIISARAINSSVIMDLWSRNIDWAELVDNGPKEFTIQNEKITVKLEHQLSNKDNIQRLNKELNEVEVFRESKESSREHSISEVIYMGGNGWKIIIKNPKLNSCF